MDIMAFWVSEHVAHNVPCHTHDFYQLIFCKQSGGAVSVRNARYAAGENRIYLAKPGVSHSIEGDGRLYILEVKFLAEGASAAALKALPDHWDISQDPLSRRLMETAVSDGLAGDLYCGEAVSAALKLLLILALRKTAGEHRANPVYGRSAVLDMREQERSQGDVRILNLKYYINNNLRDPITLDTLAREVNFSKPFFVKRFQQLFDMPPMKYVNAMRINRAKELLLQTKLPVGTVAEMTGFHSLHYFSRSFRAAVGVSPQQFREQQE